MLCHSTKPFSPPPPPVMPPSRAFPPHVPSRPGNEVFSSAYAILPPTHPLPTCREAVIFLFFFEKKKKNEMGQPRSMTRPFLRDPRRAGTHCYCIVVLACHVDVLVSNVVCLARISAVGHLDCATHSRRDGTGGKTMWARHVTGGRALTPQGTSWYIVVSVFDDHSLL